MTNTPSHGERSMHEWSLQFWAQLARFAHGAHHDGQHGEADGHRIHLEWTATGGFVRIERLDTGTHRDVARYPFQLADAPVAVAHVVAKLVRAHDRDVLDAMHLTDFLRTLQRAERRKDGTSDDAERLQKWAARLLPYMERDPAMTVADALERYHADERAGRATPPRPGSTNG